MLIQRFRRIGALGACIAIFALLTVYVLPFVTNSFEVTRQLADYIDESGIETGQFFYTGVESTARAESGARGAIAFTEMRQSFHEKKRANGLSDQ